MPSPPRICLPGTVVFITSRVEEGLPFVCTSYMRLLLQSALGRAQHLHPLRICHFLMMGNHVHFLAIVENPDDVPGFMDRFKTEMAHAINGLLGRRKRTVWCKGYDCVPILTEGDVREKIAYIYTNPQAVNLVDTIDEFPGLSSWEMFKSGNHSFEAPWIQRPSIIPISKRKIHIHEEERIVTELRRNVTMCHTFRIDPNAWMKIFSSSNRQDPSLQEMQEKLLTARIRDLEQQMRGARLKKNLQCLGIQKLRNQVFNMPFNPKKFSLRMWCICSDVDLRKKFIATVKALRIKAKEVLMEWKRGSVHTRYPLGLFPPSFPKLGNILVNGLL
jgi:REP element-mobilizing transposase RayT